MTTCSISVILEGISEEMFDYNEPQKAAESKSSTLDIRNVGLSNCQEYGGAP